jgi:hypothetical protein
MSLNPFSDHGSEPHRPPSPNPFGAMVSGMGNFGELEGCLLIVTPTEYRPEFETVHGEQPVVFADVVVLDEDDPVHDSEELHNKIIFGAVLVPKLRRAINKKPVLGRLITRKPTPGKSGAKDLKPASPYEETIALRYWEHRHRENP